VEHSKQDIFLGKYFDLSEINVERLWSFNKRYYVMVVSFKKLKQHMYFRYQCLPTFLFNVKRHLSRFHIQVYECFVFCIYKLIQFHLIHHFARQA